MKNNSSVLLEEEYFTYKEVSKRFKISKSTVYRLVKSGKLKVTRFGKTPRISRASIMKVLIEG